MIVNAMTKNGQCLLATANRNIGHDLTDVYKNPSAKKQRAYYNCLRKYFDTPEHRDFRICTKNTFQFTVAWYGLYLDKDGVAYDALYVETATNSYIVI